MLANPDYYGMLCRDYYVSCKTRLTELNESGNGLFHNNLKTQVDLKDALIVMVNLIQNFYQKMEMTIFVQTLLLAKTRMI